MTSCAVLSFRLGGPDGVSIVAATWQRVLDRLGFDTYTVAGTGSDGVDRVVPGLELPRDHDSHRGGPDTAVLDTAVLDTAVLDTALADADLVLAENILTIPMHLPASRAVAAALAGRPAVLHHHDPPWQREHFSHITELPARDPAWRHVTINELTTREFRARGIEATTIHNGFDLAVEAGDRAATRRRLGVDRERLIVHPVRAIARKDIPRAVRLAEQLSTIARPTVYWLTGAAEDGYGPELERILGSAECRVIHQGATSQSDIYAAADLVVFPSIWEGFGNPPIEAAVYRKPVAVSHHPVAEELRALGFDWPDPDDLATLAEDLNTPDPTRLDQNERVARAHFGLDTLENRVELLLGQAGWLP